MSVIVRDIERQWMRFFTPQALRYHQGQCSFDKEWEDIVEMHSCKEAFKRLLDKDNEMQAMDEYGSRVVRGDQFNLASSLAWTLRADPVLYYSMF